MSIPISIITPTYNAAATLADNLNSVKHQNVPVEQIVIDGDSTDNTMSIVRQYSHVAQFVSEPDNGIYDAMNKGLCLASGEIVGILNADDFYADCDVLSEVVNIFSDPHIDACYGDLVYVRIPNDCVADSYGELPNQDGTNEFCKPKIFRYWKSGEFNRLKFFWGWMPAHPTFFVRRKIYETYGLFNLTLGTAADYELMLRFLLKQEISCKYIPKILVIMRAGGISNVSLKNRFLANRMDRQAWKVNGLKPYPWTIPLKPIRKISQWWKTPSSNCCLYLTDKDCG